MSDETIIDLIRHGQPVGGRRYRGQRDDPLSEEGWREMWDAVAGHAPWQAIVSSPLSRCLEFASRLGERLGVPLTKDARLREVGFGEWEGHTPDELRERDPELLRRFYLDPVHQRPRGAEPLEEFSARVVAAFHEVLERHRRQHVLVVAHAGVIRAVLAHVLDAPLGAIYRVSVETASLSRIRNSADRPPTLVFHGRRRL